MSPTGNGSQGAIYDSYFLISNTRNVGYKMLRKTYQMIYGARVKDLGVLPINTNKTKGLRYTCLSNSS